MEKEKVLEIESQEVFDKVAVRIKYQNEDVLPRGAFEDADLRISSKNYFAYYGVEEPMFILGLDEDKDNKIIVLIKEEFKDLEERINKLNEKYGIPKRWRAENGERYYSISTGGDIYDEVEGNYNIDTERYELGNYFKTFEEVKKVIDSKEWQDLWAKVRAGEIGNDYK